MSKIFTDAEYVDAHLINFLEKLDDAFHRLRCGHYFAHQKWLCCRTCGVAAVPESADRLFSITSRTIGG
jgi:hypothetical protein